MIRSLVLAAFAIAALAFSEQPALSVTFNTYYSFGGTTADGTPDATEPLAGLLRDKKGALWGTTTRGGQHDYGAVFKITFKGSKGTYSIVHSFANSTDGGHPYASLVQDKQGNYWGTTTSGGTVFKIAADGVTFSTVHNFGGANDGNFPYAGLLVDKAGNVWGTTQLGGKYGMGTVFKIAVDGSYSVFHDFASNPDGATPFAALFQDKKGNLWGTTAVGGTHDSGTVFEIPRIKGVSTGLTVTHSFDPSTEGTSPLGSVIEDNAGNLWGTTYSGGAQPFVDGTVFKIAPGGVFSTFFSFGTGNNEHGGLPPAGLLLDKQGNLWGTTLHSPAGKGFGAVFEIAPDGSYTLVQNLSEIGNTSQGTYGRQPYGKLIGDNKGNVWGTTYGGGLNGYGDGPSAFGSIFEITP